MGADWCVSDGIFAMCGTAMKEFSRRSEGVKWCFWCRSRHEFFWVVSVPDGDSYYGPTAGMEGLTSNCSDLFPGWIRQGIED